MPEELHRLTRHMAPDEVDALVAVMASIRVAPGDVVVRDGQDNDALYVVVEGAFSVDAVVGGQAVHLGDPGEGDTFGELSLLTAAPAMADVRATSAGTLRRLRRADLDVLRERSPSAELALVRALTEDLAERVRECSTALRQGGGRLGRLRGAFSRLLGGRAA